MSTEGRRQVTIRFSSPSHAKRSIILVQGLHDPVSLPMQTLMPNSENYCDGYRLHLHESTAGTATSVA
jgi:hypothetical protein